MLRVLAGESYNKISSVWTQTESDGTNTEGRSLLAIDSGIAPPG